MDGGMAYSVSPLPLLWLCVIQGLIQGLFGPRGSSPPV
jgi:hypothetical protein